MKKREANYSLALLLLIVCFGLIQVKKENRKTFYSEDTTFKTSISVSHSRISINRKDDYLTTNAHLNIGKSNQNVTVSHFNLNEIDYLELSSNNLYLTSFGCFNLRK